LFSQESINAGEKNDTIEKLGLVVIKINYQIIVVKKKKLYAKKQSDS